jgi:hypothetical protein
MCVDKEIVDAFLQGLLGTSQHSFWCVYNIWLVYQGIPAPSNHNLILV